MAQDIVIAGEPIPGDDLGPIEATQLWRDIQARGRSFVSSAEALATTLAEFWDRGGTKHMKWGSGAAAYIAATVGVNKSRVYQLIAFGRARWHLSTRVDKSVVKTLGERALRPLLKVDPRPDMMATVIQQAVMYAKQEADGKAKSGKAPPATARERHVKAAMITVMPYVKPQAKAAKPDRDVLLALISKAYDAACVAGRKCPPRVRDFLQQALEEARDGKWAA